MCGIAGAIGGAPDERVKMARRAMSSMCHRGPDGAGEFHDDDVSLVHTRLAIIDPTAASDQPMTDLETGCVLVFNGEIYSYRELRAELEGHGHRFRSGGDTEVLLRAYIQWGDRCLDHLNGMFAFALWDPRERSLLLARDRLGEKPLHLCERAGSLWFASEAKALLSAGASDPSPSMPYLAGYLALGDLGHPTATVFDRITQLPAGHALRVGPTGVSRRWAYWSLPAQNTEPTVHPSPADFADLFDDSVRLRLRSDVPLGTSLSGGLDSSLVLATVRRHRPDGELHAFTASFPGSPTDELDRAQAVADRLGATIHPVRLSSQDLVDDLDAMLLANEAPVESPSTLAQFEVMREAQQAGITVLLDGQGADETWAGYDKHAAAALLDLVATVRWPEAARFLREWRSVRGSFFRPSAEHAVLLGGPALWHRTGPSLLARTRTWLSRSVLEHLAEDPLRGGWSRVRPGQLADEQLRLDLRRITLPRLLRYADRNSMAASREVRLPFLDHRIVELAASTPWRSKIIDGWTKEPVRRSLSALGLPDVARRRDKLGYMPPTADWLRAPAVDARVRHAWDRLHRLGLVRDLEPVEAVLPRWRVLVVDAWSDCFGVSLG